MLRSSARRAAIVSRIEGRAGEFRAETDISVNLKLMGNIQTKNEKVIFNDVVCLVRQTLQPGIRHRQWCLESGGLPTTQTLRNLLLTKKQLLGWSTRNGGESTHHHVRPSVIPVIPMHYSPYIFSRTCYSASLIAHAIFTTSPISLGSWTLKMSTTPLEAHQLLTAASPKLRSFGTARFMA